jgi:hypothetical protein
LGARTDRVIALYAFTGARNSAVINVDPIVGIELVTVSYYREACGTRKAI